MARMTIDQAVAAFEAKLSSSPTLREVLSLPQWEKLKEAIRSAKKGE